MAEDIHQPHNMMVRAVLSDVAAAASFLQRYLPQEVSQALHWATLTLREGSFVDEDLRASEADCLYEIAHGSSADPVWIYVLLEHQSTPDRWMRFRLLKYCCRIWDMSFRAYPEQRALRADRPPGVLPGGAELVVLPGVCRPVRRGGAGVAGSAPLCPRADRPVRSASRGGPGHAHNAAHAVTVAGGVAPGGGLDGRGGTTAGHTGLASPRGGINYVRVFVLYILATQDQTAVQVFWDVLRRQAPTVGEHLMTYAQELRQEGRAEGRIEGRTEGEIRAEVRIIENLLREGMAWPAIERITGVNEAQFQVLKQRMDAMNP